MTTRSVDSGVSALSPRFIFCLHHSPVWPRRFHKSDELRKIVTIRKSPACWVALIWLLLGMLHTGTARANEAYEIVTNPSVVEKTISKSSLRAIFGMRLHAWPDGTAIRVFVLPDDSPLHIAFSKEKLNVFPYQLRLAWDRLVFSGTGQAPDTVNSPEEMLAKVASTPGAIGYLYKSKMDGRVNVLQIK